jgi:hypothetical protein
MSVVVRTDDGDDPRPSMVFDVEYPLGNPAVCTQCSHGVTMSQVRDDLIVVKHPWKNRPLGQLVCRCPTHAEAWRQARRARPSFVS